MGHWHYTADHEYRVTVRPAPPAPISSRSPAVMSNVTPLKPKAGAGQYRMINRSKDRGEIWLYGIIGLAKDNWFGIDGVTAKQFADDLRKLGAVTSIDLRVNSDGGVVDDARAMYNLLVDHPASITTHIDGIAASAASFVAMAGTKIRIAEGGFVMIHNARGRVYGTADDVERMVPVFRSYDEQIRKTYAARTRQSDAQLQEWMRDERWFDSAEAVKFGFADEIVENMRVAACITDPTRFAHLPAALRPNRAAAAAAIAAMRQ